MLGSSVRKLLHDTLLASRILRRLLEFGKTCEPLPKTLYFTGTQNFRLIYNHVLLLPLYHFVGGSQLPCGLRSVSAATRLLGSRVRIPPKAWMSVSYVCCVGSGFCDWLITRQGESYRLCDLETATTERSRPQIHCIVRCFIVCPCNMINT
jgi:hypothetical protein